MRQSLVSRPMANSAPSRHRRDLGFTLIELLVVLTIIALLASIVVASFVGSDHATLVRNDADRMVRVIELARREATMRNELWGVRLESDGYEFAVFDFESEEWFVVDRRPYAGNVLEQDLELVFSTPEEMANQLYGEQPEQPQVVIEPSGELTPFDVIVRHTKSYTTMVLGSDGFSQVEMFEVGISEP